MPIFYPDFSFGSLAYFKRLSINTFYDYAKNIYPKSTTKKHVDYLNSYGFELFADINIFRTRYPIRLKFQQGWAGGNLLPFNSFSLFIDFYEQ